MRGVADRAEQIRPDDVKDRCDLTKNPDTAEQFTPQI